MPFPIPLLYEFQDKSLEDLPVRVQFTNDRSKFTTDGQLAEANLEEAKQVMNNCNVGMTALCTESV